MAFQPAPKMASVELVYAWNGQVVENVFHVKANVDFTEGMCEDTAQAFYTWWLDNLKALQSDQIALQRVVVKGLHAQASPEWTVDCISGCAGTQTGASVPGNVAAVISLLTGLTGRSQRGRSYFPGFNEASIAGNQLTTGAQTALIAAYEELIPILGALDEGIHLVVLSRFHDKAPRAEAIGQAITGMALDIFLDSMRRRLSGRGQ